MPAAVGVTWLEMPVPLQLRKGVSRGSDRAQRAAPSLRPAQRTSGFGWGGARLPGKAAVLPDGISGGARRREPAAGARIAYAGPKGAGAREVTLPILQAELVRMRGGADVGQVTDGRGFARPHFMVS